MNLSKKYLIVKKDDHPALGNFIHHYLFTHKIKKTPISNALGISYNTFNKYLKNTSFQFTILWRISKIVNYNFLMDLGEWLKIPYETQAEKTLKNEVETLQQELLNLKRENELLKDLMKK